MKKLGLISRWSEFPTTGVTFDSPKARTITIDFNSTAKVAVTAQLLDQGDSPSRVAERILVGVVDGLETLEFRATGPVRVEVVYTEETPSKVFYHTDEGRNYAIDGEHLRDFTVPMVGRRERNPEMEAFRYEMKQQFAQYGDLFAKFMASQGALNAASNEIKEPPKAKSDSAGASAGGSESDQLRSSPTVDTERAVPQNGKVAAAADASDPQGGQSANP